MCCQEGFGSRVGLHGCQVERCQAVAGLSLGEYTALTVAGVFDFETGLKVVKLRGEAMQAG